MTKNLVIYQAKNGAIELKLDSNVETVRASQKDIVRDLCITQPKNHQSDKITPI